MGKVKKVFTQVIALAILLGILLGGVWGLYIGMGEMDKPVSLNRTDSINNYIEINGYYIRRDALLQEVVAKEASNEVEQSGPNLEEILNEAFGNETSPNVDYSIFGVGKRDIQRLYIQSVINSMTSDRTIHVSRWVTSGDWSQDDEDMTITIP